MASYVARVRTPRSPVEAFDYLADLRNFAKWDPGVVRSEQVTGAGPELGAVYDVTVSTGGREMTLRYEVVEFEPPHRIKVVGKSKLFTSIDVIEVTGADEGSLITYDAKLEMPFPLSLADPLLAKKFQKIGDKAVAGLEKAVDGTQVA